jgi:hypothetical protein
VVHLGQEIKDGKLDPIQFWLFFSVICWPFVASFESSNFVCHFLTLMP